LDDLALEIPGQDVARRQREKGETCQAQHKGNPKSTKRGRKFKELSKTDHIQWKGKEQQRLNGARVEGELKIKDGIPVNAQRKKEKVCKH